MTPSAPARSRRRPPPPNNRARSDAPSPVLPSNKSSHSGHGVERGVRSAQAQWAAEVATRKSEGQGPPRFAKGPVLLLLLPRAAHPVSRGAQPRPTCAGGHAAASTRARTWPSTPQVRGGRRGLRSLGGVRRAWGRGRAGGGAALRPPRPPASPAPGLPALGERVRGWRSDCGLRTFSP